MALPNRVLDEVARTLDNETYTQDEKLEKLFDLKRQCENWLRKESQRTSKDSSHGAYLCDFAKLQFPRNQDQRSSNHVPVR